jgi:hypothetical protein
MWRRYDRGFGVAAPATGQHIDVAEGLTEEGQQARTYQSDASHRS